MPTKPIDFTLKSADDTDFVFDADYRKSKNAVVDFYRGHW